MLTEHAALQKTVVSMQKHLDQKLSIIVEAAVEEEEAAEEDVGADVDVVDTGEVVIIINNTSNANVKISSSRVYMHEHPAESPLC
jgi:hypothetical protein